MHDVPVVIERFISGLRSSILLLIPYDLAVLCCAYLLLEKRMPMNSATEPAQCMVPGFCREKSNGQSLRLSPRVSVLLL